MPGSCFAAVFWIAGVFTEPQARLGLWAVALSIEYISPSIGFWTPGLGRSATADWDVAGSHMAERCGLFVIIALGESILVTGAKFADLEWSGTAVAAFAISFVGSVAMWWIYFNIGAETASRRIANQATRAGSRASPTPTCISCWWRASSWLRLAMNWCCLTRPANGSRTAAVLLGGPALYLVGNLVFKRATANRPALSHIVGLVLLALVVPMSTVLEPLAFSIATTAVLVVVAVWETLSLRPASRGQPAVAIPSSR